MLFSNNLLAISFGSVCVRTVAVGIDVDTVTVTPAFVIATIVVVVVVVASVVDVCVAVENVLPRKNEPPAKIAKVVNTTEDIMKYRQQSLNF